MKIFRSFYTAGLFILFFGGELLAAETMVETWQKFEIAVRDQLIPKVAARRQFQEFYPELKRFAQGFDFQAQTAWVFPVKGYTAASMGQGGFQPGIYYGGSSVKGYDFYDGNRHGGHPAYDIFIRDRNQDSCDDRTKAEVAILAPVDLLILSVNTDWQVGSAIRGGNYIWALDVLNGRLFYFAHLQRIDVVPGNFRKAGQALASMGRTGKNAFPQRSPTHLHMMVLQISGQDLKPFDYGKFLQNKQQLSPR